MTAFGILSSVFNAAAALLTCALIHSRGSQRGMVKYVTLIGASIGAWATCYTIWLLSGADEDAILWLKLLSASAICIPWAFLCLASELVGSPSRRGLWISLAFTLPFVPLSFTDLIVAGVRPMMGISRWPVGGELYWLYVGVFAILAVWSNVLLWRHFLSAKGRERNMLKYVVVSASIGFVGGALNFPGWFNWDIPPLGTPLVGIHMVGVGYSVVHYRLLPFNLGVARVAVAVLMPLLFLGSSTVTATVLYSLTGSKQLVMAVALSVFIHFLLLHLIGGKLSARIESYLERKVTPQLAARRAELDTLTRNLWLLANEREVFNRLVEGIRQIAPEAHVGLALCDANRKNWTHVEASDPLFCNHCSEDSGPAAPEGFSAMDIPIHDGLGLELGRLSLWQPSTHEDPLTVVDERLLQQLTREVGRIVKTKRLERAAAETEKMIALGTLAAGIAHEFRNPLASIRLYVELVGSGKEWALNRQEEVEDEINRIYDLIRNIEALARGSRTESQLLDVRDIVFEAIAALTKSRRCDPDWIEVNAPDSPVHVNGSAPELTQVFVNLLKNATDALRLGESTDPQIQIDIMPGEIISVRVADNGPGIPPADLPKIWNAFYSSRSFKLLERGESGMGLGLAFAQVVLGIHNARIRARNREPHGAEFTVEFPTPVREHNSRPPV